jgi:hypothetical protein
LVSSIEKEKRGQSHFSLSLGTRWALGSPCRIDVEQRKNDSDPFSLLAVLAWLARTLLAHAAPFAPQLNAAGPVLAAAAVLGAVMVRLGCPAEGFGGELEEGGDARG